jgi:oxaloacetate decarboxylase gamma subunit
MLFGMGTVFVFLTSLVAITSLMSYTVNTWFPSNLDLETDQTLVAAPQASIDPKVLNAIQSAIDQFRGR